ncbi:MAG: hypothetical protein IPL25_10275 [Saprospiraceae bacterium]|nr:hypothetical protein [Candidatus Vicinibacter affinis]
MQKSDFTTFDAKNGIIKVYDSKYSRHGKNHPKDDVFDPEKWRKYIIKAVRNSPAEYQETIKKALEDNNIQGFYFKMTH